MSEIEFQVPPKSTRPASTSKWKDIAASVEARAHEVGIGTDESWARIASGRKSRSLAGSIAQGRTAGFTKGEYEVTSRTNADGETFDIYARYVGVQPGASEGVTAETESEILPEAVAPESDGWSGF